jgi:septum formation protein
MKKDFIYLASASPRRSELLEQIGVPFRVRPAAIDESRLPGEAAEVSVRRLAVAKADTVWGALDRRAARPVLGADTVVLLDERQFGKPADEDGALVMLSELSGRTHKVLTAVAVRCEDGVAARVVESEVTFRRASAAELAAYCRTGEPLDKAGAYAIQGRGAVFVERVSGSYSAVVGLPLLETAALLAKLSMPAWLAAERPPCKRRFWSSSRRMRFAQRSSRTACSK